MKLCDCGCGKELVNENNRFIVGHNVKFQIRTKKIKIITKLCECGCGKLVAHQKNRFITGHNSLGTKKNPQSIIKYKATCMERYNTDNYAKTEEFLVKYNNTCMERYNTDNYAKTDEFRFSEDIKRKKIDTSLSHFDTEHPMQSDIVKNKYKKTCNDNFNRDNPFLCPSIIEKSNNTLFEHYNVNHPFESQEIRNRAMKTNQERRNVDYPSQSEDVILKMRNTCQDRFGHSTNLQCEDTKNKSKITCLKNHDVDNYAKTFEFRLAARERMIRMIESGLKDGQKFTPTKGKNEKQFISELQKCISNFIDNDSRIIGYFPDGYIKEMNIVIELDEQHHNCSGHIKRDIQKDVDYNKIGLRCFRVKEKKWLNNQDSIISDFKEFVNDTASR